MRQKFHTRYIRKIRLRHKITKKYNNNFISLYPSNIILLTRGDNFTDISSALRRFTSRLNTAMLFLEYYTHVLSSPLRNLFSYVSTSRDYTVSCFAFAVRCCLNVIPPASNATFPLSNDSIRAPRRLIDDSPPLEFSHRSEIKSRVTRMSQKNDVTSMPAICKRSRQ